MGIGRVKLGCRKAALSILAMVFCLPAWALDLQEVELTSRLNQPLQFTLAVLQESQTPVAASQLQVNIASAATYQQRGLEYSGFLNDIILNVVGGEHLQIQGHSTQLLREPVLYLLLELQWPGGSALVQRSVIVDLPAQYLPQQKTDLATQAVSAESVAEPLPVSQGEQLHQVQRGEVLSLVAAEYRGSVDIPLHRYMRAIQQLNAAEFPAGLDQLNPGQTIRMPDPLELLSEAPADVPLHGDMASIDYVVQYGDKFSLLAQHFRGNVDMPLKAYMQQIVAANAGVLDMSGASLKSGMLLHIPRPSTVEASPDIVPKERDVAVLMEVFEPQEARIATVNKSTYELQQAIDAEVLELERALKKLEQARVMRRELVQQEAEDRGQDFVDISAVNTDLNAYRDTVDVKAAEPPLVTEQPLAASEKQNRLSQWVIYPLWLLLVFIVVAIIIAVIKVTTKSAEPSGLPVLPTLLPEEPESTADLINYDVIQDSIALLDVEADSGKVSNEVPHDATVRMHADDYLKQSSAGVAKFASADQNEVEKLIVDGELPEAAKKADKLIYSQSGDLKNWLLKLEVLAKQGKKERCYTLAAQVRGSFSSTDQQLAVEQILEQYFSGSADAAEFVPEDYNPGAPRKKSAAAELASETAEVRVYLSYGFYDMAEQALAKLMQDFPRHVDLRILNLEVLLGTGNQEELKLQSDALLQGAAQLSQAQEYQVTELLERAQNVSEIRPVMDLDLSEPESSLDLASDAEHGVVDLDLNEDEVAHLDIEDLDVGGLDLEGEMADALHREEDAYHKAHDSEPAVDK